MRIAVFGTRGQVATELARRAPEGVRIETAGRDRADFADPDSVFAAASALEADAIVNAAAYTAVDATETDAAKAETVNGISVERLAEAAARAGLPLVHLSTDYVFPGDGERPWRPEDPTGPLNVYGQSRLMGEELLRLSGARHATLRTSWVFSPHGSNFVTSMLRLGAEKDRLTVVADQIGGPTPAAAIADACFTVARTLSDGHPGGTFHFSGAPDTSWAGFAREIFAWAGLACEVVEIPTTEFPRPARRPLNSRLDCESLLREFGIQRPDWRAALSQVLKKLEAA